MSTLAELRKKRQQESQGSKTSSSFVEARKGRQHEYIGIKEYPTAPTAEPGSTAGEAFRRSAAVNALPTLGGIAAGAASGAALGTSLGPVGTVVGFLAGGITGAIVTKKVQDEVLTVVKGEEWKNNLDRSIAEDRKAHPFATLVGEAAPQLITFKPSPSTLKGAFNLSKRALTDTKSLSTHITTVEGKTELDALMNVAIGSGVDVSLETYQQAREGDINALRIIGSAVLGGAISDPNRLGIRMGFKPSGDAVVEEYNKYGAQTPAAKIVAKGEIPILDRSADALFRDRLELKSILRGEAEANRFTDPRILQAEKLAGTIDKDVTPDSDLNIYRLDGRSGPMRIGERVTANPHIADVFGGRINPEATVKAGDLVRTSQGDYVYIPKSAIAEQPKLPPVTAVVDKTVRQEVKTKERNVIKEAKAKEVEAKRLAEEPARLQKEAEALAVKQQKEAERKFAQETRQAETTKLRLEEEVRKTRAETQKRLAAEKVRVEKERLQIDKTRDSDIETVTKQLRNEIDKAILEHVKRLKSAKTKIQKTKENIRFKNEKAKLTAKAIKNKKEIRDKAKAEKAKIVNRTSEIRQEVKDIVSNKQKEIKAIPKPKLEIVKTTSAPDKKTVKKDTSSTEKIKKESSNSSSVAPAEKMTTIGTKVTNSQSIIKNAVEEARQTVKTAEKAGVDFTTQTGTTFVEQRKLSAEILAEKGFDDAIMFAREASDGELAKLNVSRSALYEVLYKSAIKEGYFNKYRDDLEDIALRVADSGSMSAQELSLQRMATANDPFRRIAQLKKAIIENEKKARGTVFTKEVDDLYAKIREATTEEDVNKIINDNLC